MEPAAAKCITLKNEATLKEAMKLAKKIMSNFKDDLAYISDNHKDELYDILGDY